MRLGETYGDTSTWKVITEYSRTSPNWMGLWLSSANRLHFRVGSRTINATTVLAQKPVVSCAGTYDAANLTLRTYVNGELETLSVVSLPANYTGSAARRITIGRRGDLVGEEFIGDIDELAIFNAAHRRRRCSNLRRRPSIAGTNYASPSEQMIADYASAGMEHLYLFNTPPAANATIVDRTSAAGWFASRHADRRMTVRCRRAVARDPVRGRLGCTSTNRRRARTARTWDTTCISGQPRPAGR